MTDELIRRDDALKIYTDWTLGPEEAIAKLRALPAVTVGLPTVQRYDYDLVDALAAAALAALNFIENTEGELGITLGSGDKLRTALAAYEARK